MLQISKSHLTLPGSVSWPQIIQCTLCRQPGHLLSHFAPPDVLLLPLPARREGEGVHPLTPSQVLK